jgi:multimeric flavodoxin WrbA
MKVITVIASPRKNGNCFQLVEYITKGISEMEGTNKVYFVDDLNIKPCQACKACKNMEKPTKCVINDDFVKIMNEVEDADAFIFAAPNYFGEINAQGHIFINRFYSMTKTTPNQLKNNPKCIVIHTYGARDGFYNEYIEKRARIFKSIGCNLIETLSVGKNKPSTGNCDDLKDYAIDLGKQLCQ